MFGHLLRRSPYGERGLKFDGVLSATGRRKSLSLRRAWIEIFPWSNCRCQDRSLSLRRAWIEIRWLKKSPVSVASLSLRRAWIEMEFPFDPKIPRTGRSPYGERGLKSF